MSVIINHIPENWNPDCDTSFNNWLNKIATEHARAMRVKFSIEE